MLNLNLPNTVKNGRHSLVRSHLRLISIQDCEQDPTCPSAGVGSGKQCNQLKLINVNY